MATETLRPNAAGDETSISYQSPSSGAHWEKVDEATADDGSTQVNTSSTSFQRDLYNLPAPTGSGTINFIKVYFRCKVYQSSGSGLARSSLKSDGAVTDGTAVNLTTTWTTFSQQWSTNPADGQAWEWSDINALQIGVSLKSNTTVIATYCTQVYVEVDYTSVTEKTSADTGTGSEGAPVPAATLAGSESGQGQEASSSQLMAKISADFGTAVELGALLKELFVSELSQGSDSFTTKIEAPTKGGGMKLWI